MACQTCSATMQSIVPHTFWCPRCGTISTEGDVENPQLVDICRRVEAMVQPGDTVEAVMQTTGFHEAINVPEDRP